MSPVSDDDPVLDPVAHRWAPYVLVLLVLVAAVLASLPPCEDEAPPPPAPPPHVETGPWRMPVPDVVDHEGDATPVADRAGADREQRAEPDERDVLHLARISASEAGLRVTPDCAAIHTVLLDRAARMGVSYRRAACAYSTRTCTRSRDDERRWIAHLRLDGARPAGWPQRASWARQRGAWLALVEHARRVIRGDVVAPCSPHHWGGPMDDWRAHRAGWVRVDCGPTRNHFWRDPRRR